MSVIGPPRDRSLRHGTLTTASSARRACHIWLARTTALEASPDSTAEPEYRQNRGAIAPMSVPDYGASSTPAMLGLTGRETANGVGVRGRGIQADWIASQPGHIVSIDLDTAARGRAEAERIGRAIQTPAASCRTLGAPSTASESAGSRARSREVPA